MNIADTIAVQATKRPRHVAIEDGTRLITYAELDAQVDHVAANLQAAKVNPGDIVAVLAADSANHLMTVCALARIGACTFAITPWLPQAEITKQLTSSNPAVAIIDEDSSKVGKLRSLVLDDICQPSPGPGQRFEANAEHPLILSQTSGTTGQPKSFLRSHGQMQERFVRYIRGLGWAPEDRYLALMSMSFDMGRTICLGMLTVGATVILNRATSRDAVAALVRDKGITFLHVTPMHLSGFLTLEDTPAPMFPKLRAIFVGTAPMTDTQRHRARQQITANIVVTFGCNEVGLISTLTPAEQDAQPDAVGRIIEGVEAEIVDDQDAPLPPGALGLVRFRVAMPPASYLSDPKISAKSFRDGWFYPGDVAALNAEGFLFYKGRADDVINNAGAKFYPIEVENALLQHPEVIEAAALGWPHQRIGEVAVAVVATRVPVDAETLVRFCAERIAGFKVPQMILFLPELPKAGQGKIQRAELKPLIEQEVMRIRDQGQS